MKHFLAYIFLLITLSDILVAQTVLDTIYLSEVLLKEDKEQTTAPKTILTAAHGGRIDKPLIGRSRYI